VSFLVTNKWQKLLETKKKNSGNYHNMRAISRTVVGWELPRIHASRPHLKCWGICDSRAQSVNMVQFPLQAILEDAGMDGRIH
jgi:hypothetical protein